MKDQECRNIEEMLEDYVLGKISDQARRRIEDHIKVCDACREKASFIACIARGVREAETKGEGYHIPSEVIVELALDPDSLNKDLCIQALEHIKTCSECAQYLEAARAAKASVYDKLGYAHAESKPLVFSRILRLVLERKRAIAWSTAGVILALLVFRGVWQLSDRLSKREGFAPRGLRLEEVQSGKPLEIAGQVAQGARQTSVSPIPDWRTLVLEAEEAARSGKKEHALALCESAWSVGIKALSDPSGQFRIGSSRDPTSQPYYINDCSEAESLLVRIRCVREKVLGPNHPQIAYDWLDLGKLYGAQWRHSEGTVFYERALWIRENSLDPTDPILVSTMRTLADHYIHLGRYTDAESILERALPLAEKIYRPHLSESEEAADQLAKIRDELAHIYKRTGRYAEAERLYRESLEIRLATMVYTRPGDVGAGYAYLANLHWMMGQQTQAESLYIKALELRIKQYGSEHPEVATGLSQIAMVKAAQGKYDEAESLYKRALEIREATLGKTTPRGAHPGIAMSLFDMASLYTEMGNFEKAEPYYKRALDIYRRAYGFDHPSTVPIMRDYAYNCMRLGEYSKAERLYERALAIAEQAYGEMSPIVASLLESMSLLARRQGRGDQAVAVAAKAVEARKANYQENAIILTEEEALRFAHQLGRSLNNYISCLEDASSLAKYQSEAIDIILVNKGPVADEIFERRRLFAAESAHEIKALLDSLRDVRTQVAQVFTAALSEGEEARARLVSRVDSLEAVAGQLEKRLARASSIYRQLDQLEKVNAKTLAALLPDSSALVEYFRYDYINAHSEKTTAMYGAIVLRKDKPASLFLLGKADEIDGCVKDYREHMTYVGARGGLPSAEDEVWYGRISSNLLSLVWEPIEKAVEDAKMIMIAPDGALNSIAFGSLKTKSGDYLIEKAVFHYVSTGRDLARISREAIHGEGLLAMGDPDYGSSGSGGIRGDEPNLLAATTRGMLPACDEFWMLRPVALPGARSEVESIKKSWSSNRSEPIQAYLGVDASEENFKNKVAGKRVVHIASHGYFLGNQCGAESRRRFGLEDRYFTKANPLLLSGIFLANANATLLGENKALGDKTARGGNKTEDRQTREDGILTAYEVSELDLSGVDLVVLSACATALGEVEEGIGAYGLRHAFQIAGARTIVSALWDIPDSLSADLISSFYSHLNRPACFALREVQIERLQALRESGESTHPYSWAAFIATGDWR